MNLLKYLKLGIARKYVLCNFVLVNHTVKNKNHDNYTRSN